MAASRTMAVMTATERQLTRKIIEEKDERTKATKDIWKKIDEMQAEVANLKATAAAASTASSAAAAARPAPTSASDAKVSQELQALRAELDNQRKTSSDRSTSIDQSVEDLRNTLGRVEMESQQAIGKCRDNQNALGTRLDEEVKALKGGLSGRRSEKKAPPTEAITVEPGNGTSNGVAKSDEALDSFRETVNSMEEKQQQQAKDLSAVRSVLIEVHVNLPLHAVRASRIALRSTELSREERKLALSSLEAKEQHIRADIERVREHSDQSPEMALNDLRSIGLEPPSSL